MQILIAEDDAVSRLVLSATLKKMGHEVKTTSSGGEAWAALNEMHCPLLISDWMMPDIDGLELCRRVRALHDEGRRGAPYTYIILLTALAGKTNYLGAMDAGADDFITKPFDADQLAARLRVAERILALHQSLRDQARIDALTGLSNRADILDCLRQEIERAARQSSSVGVILADLDRFKSINDTHGHEAGDDVLREAALRMKGSLRPYDHIGRYGGEEFLMVVPNCGPSEAAIVAERVRHSLSASPIEACRKELLVTGSLGVSCNHVMISPDGKSQKPDVAALVRQADHALYRAKNSGRNRVVIFDEPQN
ncbi:response regulator receiver modulated diguanylate cyclase [Abditibacterium utsteinense]|uniref:diguanylate cyclase n=1 Tax=Abditibacterium utsteinense TaxID=1960156 RepID=A0A2S8SP31_9BACT|nr:diguanylate cyclase [Abditibacterium utsteinense]PQV62550.1 response regulator receiver modulated diguanylate cyclase [Abditibacterium utsteinense]